MKNRPKLLEICAGAGGSALGFEMAGLEHVGLVEVAPTACATLRYNRPSWNVVEKDLKAVSGTEFGAVDIIAGGLPNSPFSIAGARRGIADPQDLFPATLRLVGEARPRILIIDNVSGFLAKPFTAYRAQLVANLSRLGYESQFRLVNAKDFGVPQTRPIAVLVSVRTSSSGSFEWPEPRSCGSNTVGDKLFSLMASRRWPGAAQWRAQAADIAPAIVGGSRKHGGADLGPSRTKAAWAQLGINGLSLADEPPARDFDGMPRLTLQMVAALQSFPEDWHFVGAKTEVYRQIAQALPPPVAHAIGLSVGRFLGATSY